MEARQSPSRRDRRFAHNGGNRGFSGRFVGDADGELAEIERGCQAMGVPGQRCDVWEQGGAGGVAIPALVALLKYVKRGPGVAASGPQAA